MAGAGRKFWLRAALCTKISGEQLPPSPPQEAAGGFGGILFGLRYTPRVLRTAQCEDPA